MKTPKCINNNGGWGNRITIGQEYEIVSENSNSYWVLDNGKKVRVAKSSFEPKTNELDEILAKYNDSDKPEYSFVIYKAKYIAEFKQQINKWALEKCLRVIGENSKHNVPFTVIENMVLESLREKARKEFSNE